MPALPGVRMYITTTGLVLRESQYMESSRVLTVLTRNEGKITVMARGAKQRRSRTAGASQFLAYSEMTLFSQNGRYTLTEARPIELFDGVRRDIEPLALASYIAQLLETVSDEDDPDPQMLSLGLNALYAVSEGRYDLDHIKAAFEMRVMCLAGFTPDMEACPVCGRTDILEPVFSLSAGVVHCASCRIDGDGRAMKLLPGTLDAMRHIALSDPKRIYSFTLGDEAEGQLRQVSEAYMLEQLGHGFGTLDYYKSLY